MASDLPNNDIFEAERTKEQNIASQYASKEHKHTSFGNAKRFDEIRVSENHKCDKFKDACETDWTCCWARWLQR